MFATWGHLVHRFRWLILLISVLMVPVSVLLISAGGSLTTASDNTQTESQRAFNLLDSELPSSGPEFTLIFRSARLRATDPAFRQALAAAISSIRADSRVQSVHTPYDALQAHGSAGRVDSQLVSTDRHGALAVVKLKDHLNNYGDIYTSLRDAVHPGPLTVLPAGGLPLNHSFDVTSQHDLHVAEIAALPLVLFFLLLIFGSVVGATLPLAVGILAVAGGMAGTLLLARAMNVSIYATQIVTMIGLGVAIDYSLFVVSRFREEVNHHPVAEALATTMATAGRAVIFSGLTVAIGLLGMMFFHLGNLGTMGMSGTIVVALAVLYALTTLPALLAVLGKRVNAGRLPFIHPEHTDAGRGFWHRLAGFVMARPWAVLLPTAAALLVVGVPVLHLRLANADYTTLPTSSEARQGQELLARQFPGGHTDQVLVVVQYPYGSPLTPNRIGRLYDLARWMRQLPGVTNVNGLIDLSAPYTRAQYQQLAALPPAQWPPQVRSAVRDNSGRHIAVLSAYSPFRSSTDQARTIAHTIRTSHPAAGGAVLVTGDAAFDLDSIRQIGLDAPLAIAFIMLATYLVLWLLLGSVLLPLKAVLMNLLSVTASYGALVWIFQDGHLSGPLHFTPAPIDPSVPIILLCILFGLSMDYEVMLLSRFRENYQRTGDNTASVALGLQRTGRIITGAAFIMATVFLAFTLAQTTVIKSIGLGLGLAVLVDAAVVRTLLVPAAMRLLGRWNWWSPMALSRLHARLGLAERDQHAPVRPVIREAVH